MPLDPRQATLRGPAAIAVHDDPHMDRRAVRVASGSRILLTIHRS
jgi:hypothetical protein